MRILLIAFVLVAALAAVIVATGTVGQVVTGASGAGAASTQYNMSACDASLGPFNGSGDGAGQAAQLNPEQRGNVAMMISIGKQRELPPLAWQVAIQAGMTESGLRSLDYGDRDSQGLFQMRPSAGWGSPAQITDPGYAINKFYNVLTALPNWKSQRPGASAQDVERSAFPDRYNRWEAMGAALVKNVGQVADPTGCGQSFGDKLPPPTALAGRAIQFALGQQGKPYVWGATGTDSFDCSSLMMEAFKDAGVRLPRTSREQYKAGAMLPARDAKPGDLLFWAYDKTNPATIHHVALYLGNNKIVEAPDVGLTVRTRDVNWNSSELVPQAVRPGA
ncbi:C40 family peptidase [Sciscionella marina]|uniref:C40 family peptidase n=1 Tax=Sciscionella marina TaxID=508770 RepID=UPI0003778593|nr:C40 family peptidase [Sciscionella marina]